VTPLDIVLLVFLILCLLAIITAIGSLCVVVPFVPTPMPVVQKMVELADLKGKETVYDLGCGDGRILIEAKKHHPGITAIGYELPLGIWLLAKFKVKLSKLPIHIYMRDLWTADLKNADVVFLYLFPQTCAKLDVKLQKELKPGTRVVSHGFPLPNREPTKMERVPLKSWSLTRPPKQKGPRVFLYEW